jgi:hypothetical protein
MLNCCKVFDERKWFKQFRKPNFQTPKQSNAVNSKTLKFESLMDSSLLPDNKLEILTYLVAFSDGENKAGT